MNRSTFRMNSSGFRRTAVELVALALFAMLSVIGLPSAQAATAGGFEIDGDLTANTDVDWSSVGGQPVWVDGINNADSSVFFGGSKENNPNGWKVHASGQPPAKDDIGYAYAYAHRTGGHEWADVGFERVGTHGTTLFTLELNQKPDATNSHGVSIPDRSEGDLRLTVIQHGNGDFTVSGSIDRFTSGHYVTLAPPAGLVVGASNTSDIAPITASDPIVNKAGKIPVGHFAEVAFDLTGLNNLGSQSCRASAFHVINGRSQASQVANPELKDFLAPLDITIPPDCATLHITKTGPDGETSAAGAAFTISPDPRTGGEGSVTVTDGAAAGGDNDIADPDGKADGVLDITAEPGHDYTVTETVPPAGYFLGATTEITHTGTTGSTANYPFSDPLGSVTFRKTDGESALCCATFHIVATDGPAKDAAVDRTVTDNGSGDTASTAGTVTVGNLPKGEYEVSEATAPAGYQLDASTKPFSIGPDQSAKDVTIEAPFVDAAIQEGAPSLHLAKSNDPTGAVHVGDDITYTVKWWNTGTAAALGQTVSDQLPADVDYLSSSGATFDSNAGPRGTLSVSPASIPSGTSAANPAGSFTVTVKVRPGSVGDIVTNTAHLADLSSSVHNDVIATPTGSMKLLKSVSPTKAAKYGDTLTYTLVATATGTLDEHHAVVSDTVPTGTTYVDGSASCVGTPCSASYAGATRTVHWSLGDMSHGSARTVRFAVTIDTPATDASGTVPSRTIRNVGAVATVEDPSTPSNQVRTVVTAVLGETFVRGGTQLPFTGQNVQLLLLVAAAMIGAGIAISACARLGTHGPHGGGC
ncbi:MAG: collagen binding domain-containing protein [Actinomycetes bacterium]